MADRSLWRAACIAAIGAFSLLGGCASSSRAPVNDASAIQVINRITWGVDAGTMQEVERMGLAHYLERQLHPAAVALPAPVQAQIAAMRITQRPLAQLLGDLEQRRKEADAMASDEDKKAARQAYQQELNGLARESATRSLLRALYSPNQLQEQMTWFWMNHFSIHQGKHNLRAMVGDYEEQAIHPYALGKFRDLLAATVHHPAMLQYLDNAQNAANRLNENYARELMELHTLGVDGGYGQKDVQELARILTGMGINPGADTPSVRRERQAQYVRHGLFEFNPNRHDYGDKQFLGKTVQGRGLAEVDEAIDMLCRHPATARFISRKLAVFFVADEPPQALVERMAKTFMATDGDIAATLQVMFTAPEFARSLGHKFKDPVHYVVSAVRLAYDDKPVLNAGPMINWLFRMGEPLYGRQTPDGYPLTESAWNSSGQMATRFEIARAIGSGSAGLFRTEGPQPAERPAFPQLANALYYHYLQKSLSMPTRQALDQARTAQEWNAFFLSSPEMMYR